ncbi:MAG: hypothetical protein KAJ14_10620 [Candidatus Omnitrophica bacterium]|nr:hypothetical protein [Candidatus Omnitrophota bacterium]
MDFFFNVLSSIVGGAVLLILAAIFSMKIRWLLIGVFAMILDIDINNVFRNKKAAESNLKEEIDKAKFVYVLAGRGNELQRDPFNSIFSHRNVNRDIPTKILLPQTQFSNGEFDWLMQREMETAQFDSGYGHGMLHTQVEANAEFIQRYTQNNKIELQRFNSPNIGRIIVTDRCVFYTPYREDAHGRHSKVYKFRKNGEMYYNFLRLFNQLWNATT